MAKLSWWRRRKLAKIAAMDHRDYPPIDTRAGQCFILEQREYWDVSTIAADITAHPEQFELIPVKVEELRPHVEGLKGIDPEYAGRLTERHTTTPLIMVTYLNGGVRIVDGYHRLHQALAKEVFAVPCWRLDAQQSARYLTLGDEGANRFVVL